MVTEVMSDEQTHGKAIRRIAYISYAAFALAGVFQFFDTSVLISEGIGPAVYVWAVFLIVGGCTSLFGLWRQMATIEISGLTLVISALVVFGACATFVVDGFGTRTTVALLFFAYGLKVANRIFAIRSGGNARNYLARIRRQRRPDNAVRRRHGGD